MQDPLERATGIDPDAAGTHPLDLGLRGFQLDRPDDVRAAWRYITRPEIADAYDRTQVEQYKQRIRDAARQVNVDLGGE
jgi:hypothetical protein